MTGFLTEATFPSELTLNSGVGALGLVVTTCALAGTRWNQSNLPFFAAVEAFVAARRGVRAFAGKVLSALATTNS